MVKIIWAKFEVLFSDTDCIGIKPKTKFEVVGKKDPHCTKNKRKKRFLEKYNFLDKIKKN